MGLFDFIKGDSSSSRPSIDLSDLKFISDDHIRYESGQDVTGHNKDCWRGIRVQTNIKGGQGYTVTMYNLDGNHPVWGTNIQMAPKQMKVTSQNSSLITLKGFGADAMGSSFADYGLTLHLSSGNVEKVTLHMYDRKVDIVYFKPSVQNSKQTPAGSNDFESFKKFVNSWHREMAMNKKMEIAMRTDQLNNLAALAYNDDELEKAVNFFEQALLVMPSNDDALKNLRICYTEQGKHAKVAEVKQKLEYLQKFE